MDALVAVTRSAGLSESDREMLQAALLDLKSESITSACHRFVAAHIPPGDVAIWDSCYKVRHAVVHGRGTPPGVKELLSQLDSVVRSVLLAAARKDSLGVPDKRVVGAPQVISTP